MLSLRIQVDLVAALSVVSALVAGGEFWGP